MARRILGLLLALGLALLGASAAYAGWVAQLGRHEAAQPSARQLVRLPDGREVALAQPEPALLAPAPAPASMPAGASAQPPPAAVASAALLPPERLSIPNIGVQWPVVLGDNENLPAFPAVAWLFGSGFPGRPGNMVLFGHLGGPNGTLMRLHELRPGDEFSVHTAAGALRYRVRQSYETTPDDVTALLPSSAPIATLITCSGPWDALAQTNARRLIVVADYLQP